ncbi:hypothetical protein [Butyrivibrio proteoclasticus]|uniref:hypothetical protein n=1 Tax=Butyrivibrio proteoclasticus TaxID=43305 RepID=UPI000478D8B6|nr:hypothetical protein [Butyrivibrio proteoclasticus]
MTSIEFIHDEKDELKALDIISWCPFCTQRAHLKVTGKKKMEAVRNYIGSSMLTQDLPFEASEREFIRSGYCPGCMKRIMGVEVSKNIKYVRNERR